ncbi:DUF3656 domain-containing protein [Anaerocolumna aminovalerica]|uniref:U32 family peptidase n=1 Tax=Anaerocolumna aminovalerica TaxID=1527 RepID=UPI001C0EDAAC|nr:U32 family peptidase [Anaerocolumna aminovalerica]MBU5333996.1 DUF3656 domain-containing protein [Anaerocolumna aminovalerica]
MRKIEILAPAGSIDSLKAAINASCDAVYIGGAKFGARAYADNLTEELMLQAIDYAHIHDTKIYLTVNTLLKNKELEHELYEYLVKYYEQGIDAVIVQDTGVLHFIHEHFPNLDIHGSTQMTLTMAKGANVLKQMGLTRLVTSRELGLEEIKNIRKGTDLEIETFVHGALCYCYSGQCLMSSMFGGRSGNRGRCAQPCRMPYQLKGDNKVLNSDKDKYVLSPKDISTIDMIPDLIEAGIDSFKIEGRMKRPEYAAGVTYMYRKYVDRYLEFGKEKYESYMQDHKEELNEDILLLQDLYNRGGFSQGYFVNRNGRNMISLSRPNHSGVHVGKVKSVNGGKAQIQLIQNINPQDILEIREDEKLYEFTVKNGEKAGNIYSVNLGKGSPVKPGFLVYRTKNNFLLNQLGEDYLKEEVKIPITGKVIIDTGEPIILELNYGNIHVRVNGDLVEAAMNQPMTEDKIRKQIMKTRETSYVFEELQISIKGNPFIPVQKLNELRRQGIEALSEAITGQYRRTTEHNSYDQKEIFDDVIYSKNHGINNMGIHVSVFDKNQLSAACSYPEVTAVYMDSDIVPFPDLLKLTKIVKESNKKCYIILPHIFRKTTYELYRQNKNILEDNTIDGYILRNLEEYDFIHSVLNVTQSGKDLIADYNLYVMNREAAAFWRDLGIVRLTAPVELNYSELKELNGIYNDIIVYGKIPLMVSAQCLAKTTSGWNNKNYNKTSDEPCCLANTDKIELMDRFDKNFQVKRHCRECYNTIYNSQCLSLLNYKEQVLSIEPKNIRLNFTFETPEETGKVIYSFIQKYVYNNYVDEIENYTRGHFKRGIE